MCVFVVLIVHFYCIQMMIDSVGIVVGVAAGTDDGDDGDDYNDGVCVCVFC